MLATFVIFLREGVEASMIVAIRLAYLKRSGQRRHLSDVFAGVAAALLLAGAGGLAAYFRIGSYAGWRVQTIFETVTYLLAAAVLTYRTFWMRSHARGLKSELQSRVGAVLAPHREVSAATGTSTTFRQAVAVPGAAAIAAGGDAPGEGLAAGADSVTAAAAGSGLARGGQDEEGAVRRRARAGLAVLALPAVGRQGRGTVVFTLAIAFSPSQRGGLLA